MLENWLRSIGSPNSRWRNLSFIGALIAVLSWIVSVESANFLAMGPYGLVSIVGASYFIGLASVVVGFSYEVTRASMRPRYLLVLTMIFILFLYGTAPAIEPVAALSDSWLHAGFIQFILVHGSILNNFDARFSWPGAFTLASIIISLTGQGNAIFMLRWFPLFIELLYLAPLLVIGRSSGVGKRAAWIGVLLFYATNWIYQDYFSPQALANFFLLVVIASVLACWAPLRRIGRHRFLESGKPRRVLSRIGGLDTVPVWKASEDGGVVSASWEQLKVPRWQKLTRSLLHRLVQTREVFTLARIEGHDTQLLVGPFQLYGILTVLTLTAIAMAMSHQLTPYALVVMLLGMLFSRRLGRPELPIAVALFAVAWLSLGASNFWVGHLSMIFGSVGQVGTTVGSNVTSRIVGASSHRLIVNLRILLTLAVYFLAGIGVLRRAADSRVLEILTAMPIILLVAQGYGGEGLMRAVLFGLPFAALLAASAIVPRRHGPIDAVVPFFKRFGHMRLVLSVAIAVTVLAFALVTTVVRGGNDSYESFSLGELDAVNYTYQHLTIGESIGMVVPFLPIGQRNVDTVATYSVSGGNTVPSRAVVLSSLLKVSPNFIILSQSQEAWGELVGGYDKNWMVVLKRKLEAAGYHVAAQWRTATVLVLSKLNRTASGT